MSKVTNIHVVRCSNCGAFYDDSGDSYPTPSHAWFTTTPDKKYLQQGINDGEFKKDCCKEPKLYIAKFKEFPK